MRNVPLSTDVYAKIWALRQPGEETEDAILRRTLGCAPTTSPAGSTATVSRKSIGFYARRFDVTFEEGFEIFRTFKGRDYRARATGGHWLLHNDGQPYQSLSDLSGAVGAKIENVWVNWLYTSPNGEPRPIGDLRDPSKISRRTR